MNNKYFSFLLCVRDSGVDIYYNGIPIGVIKNGEFKIHQFIMPDGEKKDLTINNLPEPCEFKSLEELKNCIIEYISKIKDTSKI